MDAEKIKEVIRNELRRQFAEGVLGYHAEETRDFDAIDGDVNMTEVAEAIAAAIRDEESAAK